MNQEALIRRIKTKAKQEAIWRRDPRFKEAMGLLVAKGFLRTNFDVTPLPNKRLRTDDAIWAGKNVEPRILEVLPAAVLRLGRHFDLDPARHKELITVVDQLRRRVEKGDPFCGIPYEKLKPWADFPLRDKRVKPIAKKKVVKTFRLEPLAVEGLKKAAAERRCTETEVLESLILGQG